MGCNLALEPRVIIASSPARAHDQMRLLRKGKADKLIPESLEMSATGYLVPGPRVLPPALLANAYKLADDEERSEFVHNRKGCWMLLRIADENKKILREGLPTERRECLLLPSSTMGPAFLSLRTVQLVDALRSRGVIFGVVTAARRSTLLERWPLLPSCDVIVGESGSRMYVGGELDLDFSDRFAHISGPLERSSPPEARVEPLWEFYRQLGRVVPQLKRDARSFYGMFRCDTLGDTAIEAALRTHVAEALPEGVAWTTNLGKYDFYPAAAGKGNAVRHLQARFGVGRAESACLFDDDNDLPMADACGRHLLPTLTSTSVRRAAAQRPSWCVAQREGQGVFATEELLEALLALATEEAISEAEEETEEAGELDAPEANHPPPNGPATNFDDDDDDDDDAQVESVKAVLPLEVRRADLLPGRTKTHSTARARATGAGGGAAGSSDGVV